MQKGLTHERLLEHASRIKVKFVLNKAVKFYCIMESAGKEAIDVNLSLYVNEI